ncbi:MAG TPA: phosphatidylserine decarboxylase [Chthoniobacterales bacterium]|jgi:phosphatidylserine decarboxylase
MRWQTIYEARWILAIVVALAVGSAVLGVWFPITGTLLTALWLLLIAYVFYFFRDPDRTSPEGDSLAVAAADGVVADIVEDMLEPEVTNSRMIRVGIFLSVFDVHTNRAPLAGKVIHCQHHLGKMLDARHPDATTLNEYITWGFQNPRVTFVVRQITGAIARRIVPWSKVGDELKKGEHFGMIRFGSRTEVYFPIGTKLLVKIGDRVKCGITPLAELAG